MGQITNQLLDLIGVGGFTPYTMEELIPYLVTVTVGTMLVVAVFRSVAAIVKALTAFRRG